MVEIKSNPGRVVQFSRSSVMLKWLRVHAVVRMSE